MIKVSENNPNVETYTGERPHCHYCNKLMRPIYDSRYDYNRDDGRKLVSRKFLGVFGDGFALGETRREGFFCNTTCGYKFGRLMARKGWRAK